MTKKTVPLAALLVSLNFSANHAQTGFAPAQPGAPGAGANPYSRNLRPALGMNPGPGYNVPINSQEKVLHGETFSISFPGGNARELIEMLKATMKSSPNVMISPAMDSVMLPAFELQDVTLGDLFQALNSLSGTNQSGQWQLSGSNQPIWVLNPSPFAGVDPTTGFPFHGMAQASVPLPRTCQIFPVAQFLPELKVEDITTAIQTAWGMLGNEKEAQMKLHKDTDLLIVVGTPEQLAIVKDVLASLEKGMATKMAQRKTGDFQWTAPEPSPSTSTPAPNNATRPAQPAPNSQKPPF